MDHTKAYQMLGLDLLQPYTAEDVHQAFRQAAIQFHPDRFKTPTERIRATEILKQCSTARDLLLDSLRQTTTYRATTADTA
ncbi:DnaJ domain-containing protein [Sulfobacillus thermosulfidooxidans]|uniref:DnaJ domain-containing protein n=1 Tax=Sulfobacillus thermosulfidooxidans TaxID=28034 RepID=UPI0006B5AF5E|nr:DnaJ domain-containing protein [Sulfobacillus thermosulfidooxidans]